DMEWFAYWRKYCMDWLLHYGLSQENLVYRDHEKEELSHYSAGTVDIEYIYPFGQSELWGVANRTDYDLNAHQSASKEKLEYHDPETNEKYLPYVIEPSLGLNRAFLAFICDAYSEDEERGVVLKLHKDLAPYKMCILPLQSKQREKAQELYAKLAKHYMVEYEASGNIGKRYKRQDAIGTPYCITVDFDTMEDNSVTVRDRDTMEQVRINIDELEAYFADKFNL
ncbi:MAG: His/Gly/Thr/Pro-type tRNA ligase C-terminal domain-containing protein, partial [Erysipelotrichales bacterium]